MELHVPSTYTPTSLITAVHTELCILSDASTKAIKAVAYLSTVQEDRKAEVGLVMGKVKLALQSKPTILWLELCAAILAVGVPELIQKELDLKLDAIMFYTDSSTRQGGAWVYL